MFPREIILSVNLFLVVIQSELEAGSTCLHLLSLASICLHLLPLASTCLKSNMWPSFLPLLIVVAMTTQSSAAKNTDNENEDARWEVSSPPVPPISANVEAALHRERCAGVPPRMPCLSASWMQANL